jgi:hypothetical protein
MIIYGLTLLFTFLHFWVKAKIYQKVVQKIRENLLILPFKVLPNNK